MRYCYSFRVRDAVSGLLILAASSLLVVDFARANDFVVGAGVEADSEKGRAISAFADFSVGKKTWLSAAVSAFETDSSLGTRNTSFANVSLDHSFDPVGVRAGISYWGNSDILDSIDLNLSLYYRSETMMMSADYVARDFDFIVLADFPGLQRTAEFSADGFGLSGRLSLSNNLSARLAGMTYNYSRNIRIQQDIDALRFLSSSRLSMVNSLIDYRVSAGLERRFGLRSADISVSRWRTAVDGGTVDSVSVGVLAPVSDRNDAEFRISFDNAENFGRATTMSLYVYFFGGS